MAGLWFTALWEEKGSRKHRRPFFTRYACYGILLQQPVIVPQWLPSRIWLAESISLNMEGDFPEKLRLAAHDVELVSPFSSMMGHAGALVRHSNGMIEGAADPRSDGCVAAF